MPKAPSRPPGASRGVPGGTGTPILDAGGRAIVEGRGVRVLALPPGLLTGLDEDDVAFLVTVPGTMGEVDEILDGEVSVQLRESASTWHFIRSPGHLLRVADDWPGWPQDG